MTVDDHATAIELMGRFDHDERFELDDDVLGRLRVEAARRGVSVQVLVAQMAGVHRGAAARWLERGWLDEGRADLVAIGLGVHPGELWPSWWQ